MTTKTKTPTPAEVSRERHAEARQTLQERQTALESVQEEINETSRAWAAGRDDVPSSRMTELREEEKRLTLLVAAAERAHKAAQRGLLTDDPELAEAIAFILNGVHHGIEATGVTTLSDADPNDLSPRIYVVQRKPHRATEDGTLFGDCTIHLVGPAWTVPLDAREIQRALKSAQVGGLDELTSNRNQITLTEINAMPWLPAIARTPDAGDTVNISDWAYSVERSTTTAYGYSLATASHSSGEVVRVTVDEDGTRTVVANVSATIHNNTREGYWTAEQAVEQTKQIFSDRVGTVLHGAGRVTKVEHLSVTPTERTIFNPAGRRLTMQVTAISRAKEG